MCLATTALACLGWPRLSLAQTWTGAVSSDWTDPANWAGGAVPAAGGAVLLNTIAPNGTILGVSEAAPPADFSNLTVGGDGTGTLAIQSGSSMSLSGSGVIGDGAGSKGSVAISGSGSILDVQGELDVGRGGDGALNVDAGATAAVGGNLNIGSADGSTGTVAVSGSDSVLSAGGEIAVGIAGNGTLTVDKSGKAVAGTGISVGGASGYGIMTVDGEGSNVTSDSFLVVGDEGTGSLVVTNAGTVQADDEIDIGNQGKGDAAVSKVGSTLTTASLNVGVGAVGTLAVSDGGVVRAETIAIGGSAAGQGAITIAGKGSSLTSAGAILVAVAGEGSLGVGAGAAVSSRGSVIGSAGGSNGSATVDGAGSTWTDSDILTIGGGGAGSMTVSAGGRVASASGVLGDAEGGAGSVHIAGNGSLWSTGSLLVGNVGKGDVLVDTGGSLRSTGAILGGQATGSGIVTVTGAGSSWTAGGVVTVGAQGTGTLNVVSAGTVVATRGIVLSSTGGAGVLNLNSEGEVRTLALTGGGTGAQANFDVGTLTALADNDAFISGFTGTQLNIQAGTLTINNAGFRITSSSPLTGDGGLVSTGPGTFITDADNGYLGATSVASGTLAIGDAQHSKAALSGGGPVGVMAGATLGGYGRVDGTVTNDGTIAVANAVRVFAGDANGTFTLTGTLLNNGVARVGGSGVGNILDVSTYVGGDGSSILLNARLGTDGSPSDLLVVDGGSATGHSALTVRNVGGMGGVTTGDGILVVDAAAGATTGADAFSLSSPAAAGAYEYNLFQGGIGADADSQDWYLRTVGLSTSAQTAVAYPDTLGNFARAMLPTLQQRAGNRLPSQCLPVQTRGQGLPDDRCWQAAGAWGRLAGQAASYDPRLGSAYRQWLGFMQAGYEGTALETSTGLATLGVYASVGTSKALVDMSRDPITGAARKGRIETTGYGLGADATWLGDDGFYADLTGQLSWFESTLSNKPSGSNGAWSLATSLEVGKHLDLGSDWALVPQARLTYSWVDFDGFDDISGAPIQLDRAQSLHGLAAARLEKSTRWQDQGGQSRSLLLYATAGLDYAFVDGTSVDVGGTFLTQQNQKLWGQAGLGAYYAWRDDWVAYGEAELAIALGQHSSADNYVVKGTAGLRHSW